MHFDAHFENIIYRKFHHGMVYLGKAQEQTKYLQRV